MGNDTAAIVFGVLPENNRLPGQVFACLDAARELLRQQEVKAIAVLGGFGHGSRARRQTQPEAHMMRDYLQNKGVKRGRIMMRTSPVTTPEVLWEVALLPIKTGRILTIKEKQRRIKLLAHKIVGPGLPLTIEVVRYRLSSLERKASKPESYYYREAGEVLKGMRPGDKNAFRKLYSFKYHVWQRFVDELRREGKLEAFAATLP